MKAFLFISRQSERKQYLLSAHWKGLNVLIMFLLYLDVVWNSIETISRYIHSLCQGLGIGTGYLVLICDWCKLYTRKCYGYRLGHELFPLKINRSLLGIVISICSSEIGCLDMSWVTGKGKGVFIPWTIATYLQWVFKHTSQYYYDLQLLWSRAKDISVRIVSSSWGSVVLTCCSVYWVIMWF